MIQNHLIIPTTTANLPRDETKFHLKNISAYSGVRRGIPARPRKCYGKNVTFTPMKV